MEIAELIRLLENVARTGTVTEIDEKNARVRVQSGGLVTTWLRWTAQRAGAFKVWVPPSIGEQVWFLCLGGNTDVAFIGGSLYSDDNPAPGASRNEMVMTAPDGATFRYDAEAGALQVRGIKSAVVESSIKITLDTPEVECTNLLVTRSLNVREGGEMHGSITHTGGMFTSNGVQVDDHDHGAVERGGSWTEGTR
ncbi:phage baseplate assembly protein V [Klebsiella quasipneumoniae subsp. similipneumoniae]|uniref:phage baseplate assembly protein V n=1 Tax=Klebsiella pneumoniae complex TaxID=3390273 RepID=UPI0018E2C944|nr:phage baseplate assembly protein V [Klebsiella variicola]HBW7048449.1 phage baseplate assembly protein V [Klebsiella pneumoniae]HCB0125974.1 phage baseplate assembly protein V [Klebsiella variicola subsp. variicola]HBZ9320728.1 phage baseplate assembly protein V [Klebsiella pneumoniae]HBZ9404617.1 phage baseplate assembly protein V [Klebsiella pneumoniae]HBZ9812482.1 phage baseplate assembly protein V [Klebsiella pneumoniae]